MHFLWWWSTKLDHHYWKSASNSLSSYSWFTWPDMLPVQIIERGGAGFNGFSFGVEMERLAQKDLRYMMFLGTFHVDVPDVPDVLVVTVGEHLEHRDLFPHHMRQERWGQYVI